MWDMRRASAVQCVLLQQLTSLHNRLSEGPDRKTLSDFKESYWVPLANTKCFVDWLQQGSGCY